MRKLTKRLTTTRTRTRSQVIPWSWSDGRRQGPSNSDLNYLFEDLPPLLQEGPEKLNLLMTLIRSCPEMKKVDQRSGQSTPTPVNFQRYSMITNSGNKHLLRIKQLRTRPRNYFEQGILSNLNGMGAFRMKCWQNLADL